jgi:hypothetical protein
MVTRWAEWAIDVVETWPHDIREATPDLDVLRQMLRRNEQYLEAHNVTA